MAEIRWTKYPPGGRDTLWIYAGPIGKNRVKRLSTGDPPFEVISSCLSLMESTATYERRAGGTVAWYAVEDDIVKLWLDL